jgi:hypothetical protein
MKTACVILLASVLTACAGDVDPFWVERAKAEGLTFATEAEMLAWANATHAVETRNAAAANAVPAKRAALRALKARWVEMGYTWPPQEGQLVAVISAKLQEIETAANAGQTKQATLLLAKCCAALALYNYVGAEMALATVVPAD